MCHPSGDKLAQFQLGHIYIFPKMLHNVSTLHFTYFRCNHPGKYNYHQGFAQSKKNHSWVAVI